MSNIGIEREIIVVPVPARTRPEPIRRPDPVPGVPEHPSPERTPEVHPEPEKVPTREEGGHP